MIGTWHLFSVLIVLRTKSTYTRYGTSQLLFDVVDSFTHKTASDLIVRKENDFNGENK